MNVILKQDQTISTKLYSSKKENVMATQKEEKKEEGGFPVGLFLMVCFFGIGMAYYFIGENCEQKLGYWYDRHKEVAAAYIEKYCTHPKYPDYYINYEAESVPEGWEPQPTESAVMEKMIRLLRSDESLNEGEGSMHWMIYCFTSIAIMQWGSGAMIWYASRNPIISLRIFMANFVFIFLSFMMIVSMGNNSIVDFIGWFIYVVSPYLMLIGWIVFGFMYFEAMDDERNNPYCIGGYMVWHYMGLMIPLGMLSQTPWLPFRLAQREAMVYGSTSLVIFGVAFAIFLAIWYTVREQEIKTHSRDWLTRDFIASWLPIMIIIFMIHTFYGMVQYDQVGRWKPYDHSLKRICKQHNEELAEWKINHKRGWTQYYKRSFKEFEKIYGK